MHLHGRVRVQHAFRQARRAAREVQQRVVLGGGRCGLELGRRIGHQRPEVERVRRQVTGARRAHDQHVPQLGQLRADRRDLAAVQQVVRDEHAHRAELQACLHGLRAERREQRAEHGTARQRAEHRGVQSRHTAHQRRDSFPTLHAEAREHVGEPARVGREIAIRALDGRLALREVTDGHAIGGRSVQVTEHGLVRDVETAARQSIEQGIGLQPVEPAARLFVVREVRRTRERAARLGDGRPLHVFPRVGCRRSSDPL